MIRILIAEDESLPLHRLRESSRRAGLSLIFNGARTAAELGRLLRTRPALAIATLAGLADLPFQGFADLARLSGVPLVIVGGDTAEEREQLFALRGSFVRSIRRSQLSWLPLFVDRIVRDRRASQAELQAVADAEEQLAHAAAQMREAQRMAVIGRLAGSIAHEINNPLESVTNLVYLLDADAEMPEHLRTYLQLAEQELNRAAQITKQTLSFYRDTQEPIRMMVSELLDEVCGLYSRRLAEKRIHLERRYESQEPLMIFPGEMRQVYANLLANAIEATANEGRIVVRVHRGFDQPAGSRDAVEGVRVVIADSGTGIPEAARARLGQPFYTTKGERGTGLGLWVSQAIIKRHGGSMQLRSSVAASRHGTTFSIFLPLNLRPRVVEFSTTPGSGRPTQEFGMRLRASSN